MWPYVAHVSSHATVELNDTLVVLGRVKQTASNSHNVSIGAPLAGFDQHASVDDSGLVVGQGLHELHTATSVGDAELVRVFIHIFIRKTLSV